MHRQRSLDVDIPHSLIEHIGRYQRGLSIETARTITKDDFLDSLDDKTLMAKIRLFEEESEELRKENLLFSRYLQRVNQTIVIQTYEEFQEQEDLDDFERTRTDSSGNLISTIFPHLIRRRSNERNRSLNSSLWNRLATNREEILQIPLFSQIEQEKLSVASYELEQSHLDWNRMKINAANELERLELLLRSYEADEISEELLNEDLQRTIDKLQVPIDSKRSTTRRVMLPGDLVVKRIQRKINDKTTMIGLLRLDKTRILSRLSYIDVTIGILERQREKMDEADIRFVRTRRIDFDERYQTVQRECIIAKAAQHPMLRQWHELKMLHNEEEKQTKLCLKKHRILEHFLEQLNEEIRSIDNDMEKLSNENQRLTEQLSNVKSVPTIRDYARLIRDIQQLHHEIKIWTKRVKIAEVT